MKARSQQYHECIQGTELTLMHLNLCVRYMYYSSCFYTIDISFEELNYLIKHSNVLLAIILLKMMYLFVL